MLGIGMGIGLGSNVAAQSGGGGRGANLTSGTPDGTDGTYSAGTFTYTGSINNLAAVYNGKLNPSTTYRLTFNYNLASGVNLRAQDVNGNQYAISPSMTMDGTSRSVDFTFTTNSGIAANSEFLLQATGSNFGAGTISALNLSSP